VGYNSVTDNTGVSLFV